MRPLAMLAPMSTRAVESTSPGAAIRRRIIGVGDGARGQISPQARIVGLPASVISLADERRREGVECARLLCARTLVKVAGILMQDGRQDGAADHDVSQTVGIVGAETLAISLRT